VRPSRHVHHRVIAFAAVSASLLAISCAENPPVALAQYLDQAEIQAETDEQRAALRQALDDMLRQPPEQLRTARYGVEQRTLPELLRAHLVPAGPVAVEDDEFYTQAQDARVKAAIARLQRQLGG
jgi:hypothetical protein